MNRTAKVSPETRAVRAAEAALADRQYVGLIDVMAGVGLLHPTHVEAWHNGRMQYLDEMLQGGPEKLRRIVEAFHQWAKERGLRLEDLPPHNSAARTPPKYQQASRVAELEPVFRVHYVSPDLPAKKLDKLREKLSASRPPTVFSIVRDSKCGQCKAELENGSLLTMQGTEPLCLECADLDHLVFLGSGDACVTRRATRYSSLWAVVVRFSRSRKRYERQGVLVQSEALAKAEDECLADADLRAARQARDAERRLEEDVELRDHMAMKIRALYPGCPPEEARRIAAHTAVRGSGRVGRSAAGRSLDDDALRLAVTAWVRHNHTGYDDLLMRGVERTVARGSIREDVDNVLDRWRSNA